MKIIKYVIQPRKLKKTIILTAFLSIMSFSLISPPKAEAVPLNSIMGRLMGGNQRDKTNAPKDDTDEQPTVAPTLPLQAPAAQETLVSSVTPVLPTTPILPVTSKTSAQTAPIPIIASPIVSLPTTPVEKTSQQKASTVQSQVTKNSTIQPLITQPFVVQDALSSSAVDTSAAVLSTANYQSAIKSNTDGTPYVSNKINSELAQYLLFAGIATITAGTLMYGVGVLPAKKQVRRNPVKIL